MAVRREEGRGWVVDVTITFPDGRKERRKKMSPVQTRRGAEAFERQLREEMLNPSPPQPEERKEVPTLAKFVKEYVMTYARNNNKPSERKSKKMILERHLLPVLGRLRLDKIKMGHIERYKARKLDDGLSPKSVNNHLTVLRKSLSLALEDDIIDRIPRVKWLKVPKPDFDFLDFDEADRLIEAADSDWRTMIIVALRTGIRQSEILALRWDDVDLVRGQIQVCRGDWRGHVDTPKGGRTREIPLSPQCARALKEHRHLRGELVFCCEDGSPLTDGKCKCPLWNVCKLAGIRRIGWHVCRHSFASHLVMLGVPMKVVQEYMGHTTIEMTMRYAHLSPEVGRECVAMLDLHGRVPYASQRGVRDRNPLELQ